MRLLLDDRMFPITATIGFVQADADAVEAAHSERSREYLARSNPAATWTRTPVGRSSLTEALGSLLPLSTFATRVLFVPLHSGWTAVFDNGLRGPDPRGAVSVVVSVLRCRGLVAMLDPPDLDGKPRPTAHAGGAVGFILYDAESPGAMHERRSVVVSRQGSSGWDFTTVGVPLPFEDLAAYQRRRKRDRLPLELLLTYLDELGVDPLREDAYDPARGVLTDVQYPEFQGEAFTLEEARARIA